MVKQLFAAQARAKTGSSLTAKGRASSEQRSMATPGQKLFLGEAKQQQVNA